MPDEDPVSELEYEIDPDGPGPLPAIKGKIRLARRDAVLFALGVLVGVLSTLGYLQIQ